jgi:hypothetical protein
MEKWRIYVREGVTQLDFAKRCFAEFETARDAGDIPRIFFNLHHFIVHVANVDKLLDPKTGSERAVLLTGRIDLSGIDLKPFRRLRNHLEHFDERLDSWVAARRGRAGAVTVLPSPTFIGNGARIAEAAIKHGLPTMFEFRSSVEAGGLMSYGTSLTDLYRRAATFADKLLKGADPATLPVEQPTVFELVINLKTAKTLGLTIPASVLSRADEVVQ